MIPIVTRPAAGFLSVLLVLSLSTEADAQGLMPVPDITGATVESEAVFLTEPLFGGEVEYRYTISSPTSAVGAIWLFKIDISAADRAGVFGPARSFPVQGGMASLPMEDEADLLAPFDGLKGSEVIVVDQLAPSGWNGGLNVQGNAVFSAADMSFAVTPGSSLDSFVVRSNRPPTIREVSITPHWILEVEDHSEVTDQELRDAFAVEQSLPVTTFALGPLDIEIGGFPHYSRLSTDLRRAEFVVWVTDAALVNSLEVSLGTARDEVFIGNNGLALAALQNMLDLIAAADPIGSNQEFRDMVILNVESLMERVPNLRNTFIPVFTATPESAELERGSTFTLTMRHFNSALEGNPPIENLRVLVRCVENRPCANADQLIPGPDFRIDETGQQLFSYVGENTGLDVIEVVENDFEVFERLALIEVNWTADADLIVPAFVPPVILAGEGETIFVSDRTKNIGTSDVTVPTVTTYYISDTHPIDIESATFLGERTVPPLAVGEFDDSMEVEFVIPAGFTGEIQFLAACADGENEVVESDENNNCSFTEAVREFDTGMVVDDPNTSLATIIVESNMGLEGDVWQQALSFDVSISEADPQNDITVDFGTQDGSAAAGDDYEATSAQVIFPAATTVLTQSIPVNVFGDFDVEDDESFTVVLTNPSSNARISIDTATGTIQNDDLVSVSVGDVSALEGNSGTTAFSFPVMIDQSHPSATVVVDLETLDGDALAGQDYNATTQQLTFAASTTSLAQNVIVDVIGDEDVEPNEGFTLNISSVSANAAILDRVGSGNILNDDSPPVLDCSNATASPNSLWPPNHKLVTISVGGVFGLDSTPAEILVTGIEQDEPVNGLGDGDTSPDGFGVGTDLPQVRRERSGLEDGRIYFISFDASDASSTASCAGLVTVGIPHDQGQGSTPIDSGVRFDSTVP